MKTIADPAVQFDIFGGVSRSGAVEAAVEALATASAGDRGAVHTKPAVARFVLDLAGWRASADLLQMRLLEPSFGTGVFLVEAARRLLDAWERQPGRTVDDLRARIRAVEVHRATAASTRSRLLALLTGRGLGEDDAHAVLDEWLRQDDFLLTPLHGRSTWWWGTPRMSARTRWPPRSSRATGPTLRRSTTGPTSTPRSSSAGSTRKFLAAPPRPQEETSKPQGQGGQVQDHLRANVPSGMETFALDTNPFAVSTGDGAPSDSLEALVPASVSALLTAEGQKAIPALAKDKAALAEIRSAVQRVPTQHRLFLGDARGPLPLPDESVHLVVTSPPYWNLKEYLPSENQLGDVEDYEDFLDQLDEVWREVNRVLVPGGRLVVVVGDVCVSRRQFGRHAVFPLHASIQERCRLVGLDNLAPIIWHKISNAKMEAAGNGGSFLGKPYEPNAIVKNDIEYILFQRKPGGYRSPTRSMRALSVIAEADHREWFQQVWNIGGASTRNHPAPFPLSLAERLVRMFSFVGDTVLDPFVGTGTTSIAAGIWGRHSVGVEVEQAYFQLAQGRLRKHFRDTLPLFPAGQTA